MADVRPLPGLRYAATQDLPALVAPPYDVISPEAQARSYERHPENVIRLELGRDEPGDDELDDRYTRAAVTFAEWRLRGVLRQDPPSFYLYEQRFSVNGTRHTRASVLARVRLEPWEEGVVLPHERTLSKPKSDRLKLLKACAANFSPILALYDDPGGELARRLKRARQGEPAAAFSDENGEEHRLWLTADALLAAHVASFFNGKQIYIADGHHRYETGLAYRDEVAALRRELLGDDAANFVLMALSAVEDRGLLVLPTHRILRDVGADRLDALDRTLGAWFEVESLGDAADAQRLIERLAEAGQAGGGTSAFVVVRPHGATLLRLREAGRLQMRERPAAAVAEGERHSEAWSRLDVAVLHELVLSQGLGIGSEAVERGEHVTYTRDTAAAVNAVRSEGADLAVLLNPTPPAAVREVALAGDRMPQKSTYFYPKLIAGLVVNPLW